MLAKHLLRQVLLYRYAPVKFAFGRMTEETVKHSEILLKTINAKIVVKSTRMGYNSSSNSPEMCDNFCNFEPTKL